MVLKEANELLTEVVVVGYGTQKKINVTGAVSSVNGAELSKRPVTSVGSALQGQMPGVTVKNQTALPGQNGGEIRIRGIGTLNDASPLLVIDGVPSGDINILNPEDVESVSVLKDAASSSIYGVRGANGVIVVTTKKGKNNSAPVFSYNDYFGFQTVERHVPFPSRRNGCITNSISENTEQVSRRMALTATFLTVVLWRPRWVKSESARHSKASK